MKIALRLGWGTTFFRVGNLAQLVRALFMYCWRLGALFQGPGFESQWSVLFIGHPNNLASDSREFIFSYSSLGRTM